MKNDKHELLEQTLLGCMMCSKEGAAAAVQALGEAGMDFPESIAGFAGALLAAYMETETPDIALLLAPLSGKEAETAAAAQSMEGRLGDPVTTVRDCVKNIRRAQIKSRLEALGMISPHEGEEAFGAAIREIKSLQQQLAALDQ